MLGKGSVFTALSQGVSARWKLVCLAVFTLSGSLFSVLPASAQVAASADNVAKVGEAAGINTTVDLPTFIGRIIYIILGFSGVVLLGLLLYAGFLWMTAGGDESKVKQAKAYIQNAVIGLVIVASSFAITAFVLSQLSGITEGGSGTSGTGAGGGGLLLPSRAGSLGGGIIEYHAPPPNATGVPRNTGIVISFKEPIYVPSLVRDWTLDTSTTNVGLNTDVVKIYKTGEPTAPLATADVRVRMTEDHKTFVFKPVQPLGSPVENTDYTVELLTGLRKQAGCVGDTAAGCQPAFSGSFSSGYKWQFQVSTVIDTTPPRIVSVIPSAGSYAPNIVVQVNFNEMIDPTSASGAYRPPASNFPNLQVSATPISNPAAVPSRPAGEFKISNQYRTVEFVTDTACTPPSNSCGQPIFCLPSNSTIRGLVRAATLSSTAPAAELTASGYDGVVDLAGNSLDGDGSGTADGPNGTPAHPATDNYSFSFGTTDTPNLTAPKIRNTNPPAYDPTLASNIPVTTNPEAIFDSILRSSTVNSESVQLTARNEPAGNGVDTFYWSSRTELLNASEGAPTVADPAALSKIVIDHRPYLPWTDRTAPAPLYSPFILSTVQNLYQNCFVPSSAYDPADPNNAGNPRNCTGGPNCCDNHSDPAVCPYR
jgi:hypothetical protein